MKAAFRVVHRCLLLIMAALGLVANPAAAPQQRIALVIGNAAYRDAPLRNPVNDANDFSERLRNLGFEVTLLLNAGQRQMKEGIRDFSRSLGKDRVGLFYYAGHGVELAGQNYLIPIDADIQSEADVEYEAINAGRLLSELEQAGNGLNMVVLDACRNNPYTRSFRSASRGLARMDAPAGTLILYATQPGQVAQDGQDRNGLFTGKLLESLGKPGLKVEEVFKQTAMAVNSASGGSQIPWQEGVILGYFYFYQSPGKGESPDAMQPRPTQEGMPSTYPADVDKLVELEVWNWAREKDTAESYGQYLKQFPNGRFSGIARLNLKERQRPAAPEAILAAPPPQQPVKANMASPAPESKTTALFDKLDMDKDGKVSKTEFMNWRQTQFAALDRDKNSILSRQEIAGKSRFARMIGQNFDLIDSNNDRNLSTEEFLQATRRRFIMFDTSRDGYLSKSEMVDP